MESKVTPGDRNWTAHPEVAINLEGLHLALLLSIISTAIIMLMSIMFFTSWLLKCLKKEEMKHLERKEETEGLRPQVNAEQQMESLYTHNGGPNHYHNNNNSNNIQNNRCNNSQEQQSRHHQKNYPDPPPLAAYSGIKALQQP